MEDNPFRLFDEDNFDSDTNPHDIGLDPKGFENLRAICSKIPSFNLDKLDHRPLPQNITPEYPRQTTMASFVEGGSGPSSEQNVDTTAPLRKPILCHSAGPWISNTNWSTQINDCFGENTDEAKAFIASNVLNCVPFNSLANLRKAGTLTLTGRWRSLELKGYDALKMRVLDHYYKDLAPIGYPLGIFAIGHAYLKLQMKQKHEYTDDIVLMSLETIKTHKIGYVALTVGLLLIPSKYEHEANIHDVMSTEDMVTAIKHLKLHDKTGYSVFNMLSHLLVGGTEAIEPIPRFLIHHSQLAKFLNHFCVGKDSVNTLEVAISPRASDLPTAEYIKEPEYEPQRLKSAVVVPEAQQTKLAPVGNKSTKKQDSHHDQKQQGRKPTKSDVPDAKTEVETHHKKEKSRKRNRSQDEEENALADSVMIEAIEKTNVMSGVTRKSKEQIRMEEDHQEDDTEFSPSEQEAIRSSMQRKRNNTNARKESERAEEEERKKAKREKMKTAKKAAKEAYKAALVEAMKDVEVSDGDDTEEEEGEEEDDRAKDYDEMNVASSDSSQTKNTNTEEVNESQDNEDEEEMEDDEVAIVDFSDRALFGTNKSILKHVLDRLQKLEKSHIDTETRMVKYENKLNTFVSSCSDSRMARETKLNRALLKSGAAAEEGESSRGKKKKTVSEMTTQEAIGTIVTITGKSARKVKEVAEIFKPGFLTAENCEQAAEMLKSYFEMKGKKHLAQNVKPKSLLDPAYLSRCKTAFDIAKAT